MVGSRILTVTLTIAGGMILAACHSDIPESAAGKDSPVPGTGLVSLSFNLEGEQGRASVVEEELGQGGTVLRWDAEDEVTMWLGERKTPCTFVTKNGGVRFASFSYQGKAVGTKTYFGFYPSRGKEAASVLQLSVPVSGEIRQEKANDSHHLAPYRPMYAPVVVREEENEVLTGVCFRPLTSLIAFRLTNDTREEVVYQSVSLVSGTSSASEKVFYSKAVYEAGSNWKEVSVVEETKSSYLTLSLGVPGAGMRVGAGQQVLAFMPLFPSASIENVSLRIELVTSTGYVLVKPFPLDVLKKIGCFRTGAFYVFNVRQNHSGLVIDSPVIGEWEDGGDIEIPID